MPESFMMLLLRPKCEKLGDSGDVSELFGDSETEKETGVSTRSLKRARAAVAETSDFEPEKRPKAKWAAPTRKSTRAQTSKSSTATSKSSFVAAPTAGAGRNKELPVSNHCLNLLFLT